MKKQNSPLCVTWSLKATCRGWQWGLRLLIPMSEVYFAGNLETKICKWQIQELVLQNVARCVLSNKLSIFTTIKNQDGPL